MVVRSPFLRTVRLGISSLLLHKLRSFLTTLGVLFGVASVIAMLAVGEGASEQAQEQIRQLGSQNVILRSVKPPEDQQSNQETRVLAYGLTDDDRARARLTFPGVRDVVPVMIIPEEVRHEDRMCRPRVMCTEPDYLSATGRVLQSGRFLSELDEKLEEPVCVLSFEVARYLFPYESPIGRRVRVGSEYFEVVGILLPRVPIGQIPIDSGAEVSGDMMIPLASGRRMFGTTQVKMRSGSRDITEVELHEMIINVERAVDVPMVADAARTMLDREHREKDWEVVVPLELLLRAEETKRIFNIVLGSIAGISLLVGGIGIMNVMLATVTERTREIGIRRALGAKRRHIVIQFLVETVVLSGFGGFAGVALGLAIPAVVEATAGMPTIVTPQAPTLAFLISVGIGVVFGLYPAWRAAHMDPVEALRHE
jgi:putative ABC transport system permease protein